MVFILLKLNKKKAPNFFEALFGAHSRIISHESALVVYELSDINPKKIHMTVPLNFRKGSVIPKILDLHKGKLEKKDVTEYRGLKITNIVKTLTDLIEEKRVSEEFIEQATKQALNLGLLTKKEIKANAMIAKYAI